MTRNVSTAAQGQKGQGKQEEREWMIANAAYYLAEKRGFAPGQELEDWFVAEKAIVAKHPDTPAQL